MPLPIQNLPKGLVGYLGLNTSGVGPAALADQLAGILDVAEFYNLYQRERSQQGGVAAGGGAAGSFAFTQQTVPNNEAWLVYLHTVNVVVAATLTWQGCTAIQMSLSGGNGSWATGAPIANSTAVNASVVSPFSDRIFLAPPGAIFGGITQSVNNALAATASSNLDFVRFRL